MIVYLLFAFISIPLIFYFTKTYGLEGTLIVPSFIYFIQMLIGKIQIYKLVNGSAKGIFNKWIDSDSYNLLFLGIMVTITLLISRLYSSMDLMYRTFLTLLLAIIIGLIVFWGNASFKETIVLLQSLLRFKKNAA